MTSRILFEKIDHKFLERQMMADTLCCRSPCPTTTTKLNTLEGQKLSKKPLKPPRKSILAASTQGMAAKGKEIRKYYSLECRPPQINSLRVKPSRK